MYERHPLMTDKKFKSIFSKGPQIPGTMAMLGKWLPAIERSSFVAFIWAGFQCGTVFAMPICGLLAEYVSWESNFYVFGGTGVMFSIMWYFIVFSTPADHPRITKVNYSQ
jgi:ACS family sodium-dependent inorganic phosphate cotransporter